MSRSLQQIFAIPAVVALASVVGLVAALVGDGGWDLLSWVTLGLAVALAAWHSWPRRPRTAAHPQARLPSRGRTGEGTRQV